MGDMHFSQGDGEVAFCGAVEMSGFLELKCDIIRGGMEKYLTPMGPTKLHVNPIFEIGPLEPRFSDWLVFEGLSVDESGRQHYLDASVAYKRAVLNAVDYLSKFGYTKEQIYLLLSCCPCEGRISGIDFPNACATLAILLLYLTRIFALKKMVHQDHHIFSNGVMFPSVLMTDPCQSLKTLLCPRNSRSCKSTRVGKSCIWLRSTCTICSRSAGGVPSASDFEMSETMKGPSSNPLRGASTENLFDCQDLLFIFSLPLSA
ncbi:hypothetical protein L7F22_045201 [Adiantum nelumboides]|nr:hypothetical protein [Adiantum nelumboides]